MKPNIGIADDARAKLAKLLNTLLADEYVVYTKTRNFHWNVTGPHFTDRHKFFESQYDAVDQIIDDVAERTRSVGGIASGSLAEFLRDARLKEAPGAELSDPEMLRALLHDHESLIRSLREDAGTASSLADAGTNDFLVGLMEQHEKMAWMLRAHLA